MSDIQNLDRKSVKPLTLLSKTNEIIDAVNEQLNTSYTEKNPLLTTVEGVCTWTVTHNLETENVSCTIYQDDSEVMAEIEITSDNVVTIKINSSSNITAETYSVLILAKGSAEDGGSRITIDSVFSNYSTNPVQNKILTPSLSNFIPDNTEFIIKSDGSGDFVSLAEVIEYLNGKWSNGEVIITLESGIHNYTSRLEIHNLHNNIPYLEIRGAGTDLTTLKFQTNNYTMTKGAINFESITNRVVMRNLTIEGNGKSTSNGACISIGYINGTVYLVGVKTINSNCGFYVHNIGRCKFININVENCINGVIAEYSSQCLLGGIFKDCDTGITTLKGSSITVDTATTFNNVTNNYNQEVNILTANGVIYA